MMHFTKTELEIFCQTAKMAATTAGKYIQSQFDQHYVKQHKEGGDSLASQVVTEVDLKAQEIILKHLQPSIEAHNLGLLTEEATDDQSRISKNYFWCIDPIDGTLPFTERRSGYAVSIALVSKDGDPVVGVVFIPDQKVCYSAIKEAGVFLNNQPLIRDKKKNDTLHVYLDQSFVSEPYYGFVKEHFTTFMSNQNISRIQYHTDLGGVCNAIGVLSSDNGCYFKFPKKNKGCGSIWDYAATRLLFEELGLPVNNALGNRLHLNNTTTTFMNDVGILYVTDDALKSFLLELGNTVAKLYR